jgi:hypothetical protein
LVYNLYNSLLSTLHTLTLATTTIILVFVVGHSLLATSRVRVSRLLVIRLQLHSLLSTHINISLLLRCESLRNVGKSRLRQSLRESNLEDNIQVTSLKRSSVERKTLLFDGLDVVGLNYLARFVFDSKFGPVKVLNHEVDSSQSLKESNLLLHQEIGTLSLKGLMGLLLNNYNHVASLSSGELVSFAVESVLLPIGCSFVDFSLKDLLFLGDLLAIAGLALVLLIDDLTLSIAVITTTSRLRVHTGSKLLHFGYLTATSASATLLNGTFFTTLTSARLANSLTIDSNLGLLTHEDLFECHFQRVLHGLHLFGTGIGSSTTAHTEHLTKNIIHAATMATATFFETFLSILVIDVALLLIREHLVGLLNLLELLSVTTAIGVMFEGHFTENLFEIVHGDILVDSEELVVFGVVDFLGWASSSPHFFESATHSTEWEATAAAAKEHFV